MAVVVAGKRKLTYTEYALIPEDRDRHEIIDGDHYVSPAPSTSPSNPRHDTVLKLELYRRAGVGEYWIVDPEARRVTVYARSEEGLTELESGHGPVASPLAGGAVALQHIW